MGIWFEKSDFSFFLSLFWLKTPHFAPNPTKWLKWENEREERVSIHARWRCGNTPWKTSGLLHSLEGCRNWSTLSLIQLCQQLLLQIMGVLNISVFSPILKVVISYPTISIFPLHGMGLICAIQNLFYTKNWKLPRECQPSSVLS